MQSKGLLYGTKSLIRRVLNWIQSKLSYTETFTFYEPTVTYSFSHYGSPAAPRHIGGQRKIHAVECSLTVYNPDTRAKTMNNILIAARVGNRTYPLIPILQGPDCQQLNYFFPSHSYLTTRWQAFVMELPSEKLQPGMIDFSFPQLPITFEFIYYDKKDRRVNIPIKTTQSTILKLQDLILN